MALSDNWGNEDASTSGDESPPRYSAEHFEVNCCPNVGTMSTYRSYDDSASRYYGALSKKDVKKYGGTFGPKDGALGSEDNAVKKYGDTFVPKFGALGNEDYAVKKYSDTFIVTKDGALGSENCTVKKYSDTFVPKDGALGSKDYDAVKKYGNTFVPKYGALGSEDYAVKKYVDTFVPKYDARGSEGYAANYRAEAHQFLRWLILYSEKKIVEISPAGSGEGNSPPKVLPNSSPKALPRFWHKF